MNTPAGTATLTWPEGQPHPVPWGATRGRVATYELVRDHAWHFRSLTCRRPPMRGFWTLLTIVAGMTIVGLWWMFDPEPVVVAGVASVVAVVVATECSLIWAANASLQHWPAFASFHRSSEFGRHVQVDIGTIGVTSNDGSTNHFWHWNALILVVRVRDGFWIYTSTSHVLWLPEASLVNGDVKAIDQLLRSRNVVYKDQSTRYSNGVRP